MWAEIRTSLDSLPIYAPTMSWVHTVSLLAYDLKSLQSNWQLLICRDDQNFLAAVMWLNLPCLSTSELLVVCFVNWDAKRLNTDQSYDSQLLVMVHSTVYYKPVFESWKLPGRSLAWHGNCCLLVMRSVQLIEAGVCCDKFSLLRQVSDALPHLYSLYVCQHVLSSGQNTQLTTGWTKCCSLHHFFTTQHNMHWVGVNATVVTIS